MPELINSTLNPGIRRTVAALTDAGFITVDSGDGETHDFACDREYGYVVCIVPDPGNLVPEARRLAEVVTAAGFIVVPSAMEEPEAGCVTIEGSYSPADNISILNLAYVHDRMLSAAPPALRSVR